MNKKCQTTCKSGLQGQPRRKKVKELIAGLKKQQSVFTSRPDISAADAKASYLISNDIASASKPYCEGEIVKTCILKAAEIVCSEKLKFLLILAWRETLWQRGFRTCCARWKHGHFGRCTTSHIYSWRWWDFVCHWEVPGIGAYDWYHNSQWYFQLSRWSTEQDANILVPCCRYCYR